MAETVYLHTKGIGSPAGAKGPQTPGIVKDSSGNYHVFWSNFNGIQYSKIIGGTGTVSTAVEAYTPAPTGTVSIVAVIDINELIHVLVADSDDSTGQLIYFTYDIDSETFDLAVTQPAAVNATINSVAADMDYTDNLVVIVGYSRNDPAVPAVASNQKNISGAWGSWDIIDSDALDDTFADVDLDIEPTTGIVHVAYRKRDASTYITSVRYAQGTHGTWGASELVAGTGPGYQFRFPNVAVDSVGTASVVCISSGIAEVVQKIRTGVGTWVDGGNHTPGGELIWPSPAATTTMPPSTISDLTSGSIFFVVASPRSTTGVSSDYNVQVITSPSGAASTWTDEGNVFTNAGLPNFAISGQHYPSFAEASPLTFAFVDVYADRFDLFDYGDAIVYGAGIDAGVSVTISSPVAGEAFTSLPVTVSWAGNSLYDASVDYQILSYRSSGDSNYIEIVRLAGTDVSYSWDAVVVNGLVDIKVAGFNSSNVLVAEDYELGILLQRDTFVVKMQTRTGPTPVPDASWEDWLPSNPLEDASGSSIVSTPNTYIQFRAIFVTADPEVSPQLV